jgi:group II intron reverse transcriptase/maturase
MVMNGRGESDALRVSRKSSKEGGQPLDEGMERKGATEGISTQDDTLQAQDWEGVQHALDRVRQAAKRDRKLRFTSLYHHIYNIHALRKAFSLLKRKAAPGVDGETWDSYRQNLEANLQDLSERLKRQAYRAKPVKRRYIPKADGRLRPLGITVLEDKIVQKAAVMVMEAIYEVDFCGQSYSYRPGRQPHNALDDLYVQLYRKRVNWVLDADICGFFDAVDHEWMMKFCEHRIADTRLLRLLRKWLKAGVMEEGQVRDSDLGTPQGGVVSPLLANVYLHYVFDLWTIAWRRDCAKGQMYFVRYADDIVTMFEREEDSKRYWHDLNERMIAFGLQLHPDKTRLIEFGRKAASNRARKGQKKPETFNFLGFKHICGETLGGMFTIFRNPIPERFTAKLKSVAQVLRTRMHTSPRKVGVWLGQVLRGYINYFGVPMNSRALGVFRQTIAWYWYRTLKRRSQRHKVTSGQMKWLVATYLPPVRIVHPYPTQRFGVITSDLLISADSIRRTT